MESFTEPADIATGPTKEWVVEYYSTMFNNKQQIIEESVNQYLYEVGGFGSYRGFYCFVENILKKTIEENIKKSEKPKFRFWVPIHKKTHINN